MLYAVACGQINSKRLNPGISNWIYWNDFFFSFSPNSHTARSHTDVCLSSSFAPKNEKNACKCLYMRFARTWMFQVQGSFLFYFFASLFWYDTDARRKNGNNNNMINELQGDRVPAQISTLQNDTRWIPIRESHAGMARNIFQHVGSIFRFSSLCLRLPEWIVSKEYAIVHHRVKA